MQVSLLIQAIPPGGKAKDQTNRTDIVDWDETLAIVDIQVTDGCINMQTWKCKHVEWWSNEMYSV